MKGINELNTTYVPSILFCKINNPVIMFFGGATQPPELCPLSLHELFEQLRHLYRSQ